MPCAQIRKQKGPRALDNSPEEMMFWPVTKEISFQDISIFSSGGHFVQPS